MFFATRRFRPQGLFLYRADQKNQRSRLAQREPNSPGSADMEDSRVMTAPSSAISCRTKRWLEETEKWPRDPLRYFAEFPFHEAYYPLGLPLEISTNHKGVLAAARQSWGPFPLMQPAPKINLRFGVSETARSDLPGRPTFGAQRGLISIISDSENFGICDVPGGFGFSWVSSATVGDAAFFRYHFLDLMIGLLLAPIHFAIVHAAC